MALKNPFLDHPRSVDETYVEHCGHALSFAGGLFVAAVACAIHAFIPALCEATASWTVTNLNAKMTARRSGSQTLGVSVTRG